jgi:hypothetical protein
MAQALVFHVYATDPADFLDGLPAGRGHSVIAAGVGGKIWVHDHVFGLEPEQQQKLHRLAERVNQSGMIETDHWTLADQRRELAPAQESEALRS